MPAHREENIVSLCDKLGIARVAFEDAALKHVARLETENTRLRAALQRIADGDEVMRDGHTEVVAVADAEAIARDALTAASQ